MPSARDQKAIDLVVANAWRAFTDPDGRRSFGIPSSTPGRFYRTTDNSCSCADLKYRPWVVCAHMRAVRLQLQLDQEEREYAF